MVVGLADWLTLIWKRRLVDKRMGPWLPRQEGCDAVTRRGADSRYSDQLARCCEVAVFGPVVYDPPREDGADPRNALKCRDAHSVDGDRLGDKQKRMDGGGIRRKALVTRQQSDSPVRNQSAQQQAKNGHSRWIRHRC